MSREDAPVFSEFWQDLVRRAPTEVRDTPATMLALSSFLEGNGAQAWVALDQLSKSDPLADLVAAALEQAVDPREWDRALPAAAGALMQRAALRDTTAQEPRAHDGRHNPPGVDGVGPESSSPGPLRRTETRTVQNTRSRLETRLAQLVAATPPPAARPDRSDGPGSIWSTSTRRTRTAWTAVCGVGRSAVVKDPACDLWIRHLSPQAAGAPVALSVVRGTLKMEVSARSGRAGGGDS